MFCVTVRFEVVAAHWAAFLARMKQQASDSLAREPGCRQFDVWTSPENPGSVFLYELYESRAAFDAHLRSEHFRLFDAAVTDWVTTKTVETWQQKA